MVVSKSWGVAMGMQVRYKVSVSQDERVLWMDGGDDYTKM